MSQRSISTLIASATLFLLVGAGAASAQGVCTYTVRAALRDCPVGPGDRLCVPCPGQPCDFACRLRQAQHLELPPPPARCQANVRCIRRDCTLFLQSDIGGRCLTRCPTGARPLPGPFTCVADSGVLPAPTATEAPEATPTETPEATETAEPTETPEPTETAEPTETPEPTETAEPTETVEPTETPEPTETAEVEPTETPEPTETAEVEPTETPEPTETAEIEPTETPEPTETAEVVPTNTPMATETPEGEPTETPEVEPTVIPGLCVGDCDGTGAVTESEVAICEAISLGSQQLSACVACDANFDLVVSQVEVDAAENNSLNGCP